jgi:hypothetical protein
MARHIHGSMLIEYWHLREKWGMWLFLWVVTWSKLLARSYVTSFNTLHHHLICTQYVRPACDMLPYEIRTLLVMLLIRIFCMACFQGICFICSERWNFELPIYFARLLIFEWKIKYPTFFHGQSLTSLCLVRLAGVSVWQSNWMEPRAASYTLQITWVHTFYCHKLI